VADRREKGRERKQHFEAELASLRHERDILADKLSQISTTTQKIDELSAKLETQHVHFEASQAIEGKLKSMEILVFN
jgi:hypothetical protein